MPSNATDLISAAPGAAAAEPAAVCSDAEEGPELVEEELLVEEISIDGMCGVY